MGQTDKPQAFCRYEGNVPIMARIGKGVKRLFRTGDVAEGDFYRIRDLKRRKFVLVPASELTDKELKQLAKQADKAQMMKERLAKEIAISAEKQKQDSQPQPSEPSEPAADVNEDPEIEAEKPKKEK